MKVAVARRASRIAALWLATRHGRSGLRAASLRPGAAARARRGVPKSTLHDVVAVVTKAATRSIKGTAVVEE